MKLYLDNMAIIASKCKKPSFNMHRGRTWDHGYMMLDGNKIKLHLDTTWGFYVYFQHGETNSWFKCRMFGDPFSKNSYDLDPFATNPLELSTTNQTLHL